MQTKHKPVLLKEVLDALSIQQSDIVFDGTLGSAGHASAILQKLGKEGLFIGTDADEKSLQIAKQKIEDAKPKARVCLQNANFKDIDKILAICGAKHINKALLDLGWSTDQFESFGKGFSFQKDEPLIMLYSESFGTPVKEIVNTWSQETLETIIKNFGEERFARRIAKAIVERRQEKEIESSKELADIVLRAVPSFYRKSRIHPATKTFQALRIAANKELEVLSEALDKLHDFLSSAGRLAIISFHSIEDRIVKQKFKNWAQDGKGFLVNKKPTVASAQELKENRRARSAKLRVYEKY